jgi:hypothetical protein
MKIGKLLAATVVCVALGAGGASAQNAGLDPTQGQVHLQSGFAPDPYEARIVSGGQINAAETIGGQCVGFIANAPDFDLYWTAGSGALPLAISVASDADTTLVVNGPDGRWYCNDDGGLNGMNPGISFNNAQSGLYDIYVGTFGGTQNHNSVLTISELVSN